MTFLELQTAVRVWVTARPDITLQMVKDAINQEYLELATPFRFDVLRTVNTVNLVQGTSSYGLGVSLVYISTVKEETQNTELDIVDVGFVDTLNVDEGLEGYPEYAWLSLATAVEVWPVPDASYTLTVRGYRLPAVMVVDGESPVYPLDWHRVIELGAASELCAKFNMHERSQMLMNKKLSLISSRQEGVTMRNRLRYGQASVQRIRPRGARGED